MPNGHDFEELLKKLGKAQITVTVEPHPTDTSAGARLPAVSIYVVDEKISREKALATPRAWKGTLSSKTPEELHTFYVDVDTSRGLGRLRNKVGSLWSGEPLTRRFKLYAEPGPDETGYEGTEQCLELSAGSKCPVQVSLRPAGDEPARAEDESERLRRDLTQEQLEKFTRA